MKNSFQTRILAVALALATLGVCVLAGFNLSQDLHFEAPTDGVWWVEAQGGLRAERVPDDSPGYRAGIHRGDILESVNDNPTPRVAQLERQIFRVGTFSRATYNIIRPVQARSLADSPHFPVQVILEPVDRSTAVGSRLIALAYLTIGLYVLFRRWTAPKATHFYVFCLVSFVLYAFKFTGAPGSFDQLIFWGNLVATALQPALFLHFAITFSDITESGEPFIAPGARLRRLISGLLYLPGIFLIGLQIWAMHFWSATEVLSHRLDQIGEGYLALYYVIAAIVFHSRYSRASSPLVRQQLKWLTRGTLCAVGPFTLLYVIPYLSDVNVPLLLNQIALLSLVLLPLTFSWAIIRYRLMDVDLIFKRGVAYSLATAALVGLYFGAVAVAAENVHVRTPNWGVWGLLAGIMITGLVFDPLKRMIQARVDRLFDQKNFDYRDTLIDFGRSLSSQTDIRALVDSIVSRLSQTLLVTRVAVFLASDPDASHPHFELAAAHGLTNLPVDQPRTPDTPRTGNLLDLRFLDFDRHNAAGHIFLENPQQVLRLPEPQQRSAALLDLNYYLPCRVANREGGGVRTVAVIGLGRTHSGDFLSSEDIEVLESLAGYIGIAIQNAQLYRRLEQKISEFERLKEFHQNIVESIHIGIFAVDLEDRIESWNAEMEVMYARPRIEAVHRTLADIFPPEFIERFDSVRDQPGTHTFYKFRLTLPTGETRTANIAVAPLITRDYQTVGRIILVDDITDRIELEAQLTQAEKLSSIGLLAAGVAHEVNTPLAVISSYTQMLSKYMRGNRDQQGQSEQDARIRPMLEKITQQTFRASEIVNGLLNFSRTGNTEFAQVDLNRLLTDTLTLLEHQFKTAGIQVTTELDPGIPRILGNEGKLQQVALNLLLNARDAMHDSTDARIRIITRQEHSLVQVLIQDFGGGIAPEHMNRIYDPFFTTKTQPRQGQHKGTGLGLAVSYGIMQEHGGKMHAESQVGIGTTFRLEFPIASSQVSSRKPSPEPHPGSAVHA